MQGEQRDQVSNDDPELIGGEERLPVVIVAYDTTWPQRFETERQRIVDALGAGVARVEHIGSTSVPGLAAKPVVDIQVSVADVEAETQYVPALEEVGYELRVRETGHRMLRTPARDVHVHVCSSGSDWERRHIVFRDWLRQHGPDRARYESVKRDLAARDWPTMNHYAAAKDKVIAEIMARAEGRS